MSLEVDPLPSLVEQTCLAALSKYFWSREKDLISLFEQYVYKPEWTIVNPEISLKALALLEAPELVKEQYALVLLAINASGILWDPENIVLRQVVRHAAINRNWDLILHLLYHGLSIDIKIDKDENRSLLYHVCALGSEEEIEKFRPYYSELRFNVELVDAHLLLRDFDIVTGIIDRWIAAPDPWIQLQEALHSPLIISHLLDERRDFLEGYLERIRGTLTSYKIESCLALLVLLSPDQIRELILSIDVNERDQWLQVEIDLDDEGEVADTVKRGIREAYLSWIQHIDWNDPEMLREMSYLVDQIGNFYNRLTFEALAALAIDYQEIIEASLPVFSLDQLCVIVPFFSCEKFNDVVSGARDSQKIPFLKAATHEQKLTVLDFFVWKCNPVITIWIEEKHEEICRHLEEIDYSREHLKVEVKGLFSDVLLSFDNIELRLLEVVDREYLLLRQIENAIMTNTPTQEIMYKLLGAVGLLIAERERIKEQVEILGRAIRNDPYYEECKPVYETKEPVCGITLMSMADPVSAHGHVFDREAIATWLQDHDSCPLCMQKVTLDDFQPS